MSLGARATKGGAKGKDRAHDKGHDKPQPKEKVKPQATTEQLRMANMIDRKGDDTADVRKMVQDLMETTCRTEEEVCSALHDADNDVFAACNILLEADNTPTGEWQTNEKKKKKPPAPANNGEPEPPRDRSRSGPRPRRGSGERGEQSSRGRGGGRGGRGGARGGRGGARGGRGGSRPRPDRHHEWPHQNMQDSNPMGDGFPATEDWDNEEWSGSLSDTKVFTPSVPAPALDGDCGPPAEDWDAAEPPDHIPTYTYHNPAAQLPAAVEVPAPVNSEVPAAASVNAAPAPAEYLQPMGMSGSLSAAQSHYLSQLTQQHHHDNSMYSPSYGVYGADVTQRKPQRARVPPPSKIPVSAVEMPGGGGADSQFLDVQFGATDDPIDPPKAAAGAPLAPPASEGAPPPRDSPPHIDPPAVYSAHNNIQLIESLSVSEPHPAAPAPAPAPPAAPPAVSAASASLEKQLSASMKQLSVSAEASPHAALPHHRPAKSAALNMYSHHPVSHHPPPVYSANVYAPQVNSSTASLSAGAGYPASAAMTQYQPALNNYQTSAGAAAAYSSGALYTAAPYTPYQPPAHPPLKHHPPKDTHQQYEAASAPASSSLASTATTQPAAAKVTTTTGAASAVSGAGGAVSVSGAAAAAGGGAAGAAYGGGALYGASQTYAPYDDQLMRSTMTHHMGAYYEVAGYGVGVGVGGGARDPAFSLGAGERFTRTDASSPQQVPTPTLPPGYAYYTYQPPPPTTYQYGVYPFGAGSNVGAGGKVGSYQQQQQPPYDAQDSYKTVSGGGVSSYSGGAGKGGAAGDLTAAIYPKQHVALNKVNSYEKAGFHSGTPPPFGAGSHLYIPAPPHHHHHQPQQHQMDVRVNNSQNRRESAGSGGRAPAAKQTHSKPYAHSYWPNN